MAAYELLAVVEAIYAAAVDSELWPAALDAIGRSIGAIGTVLVPMDPQRSAQTISSITLEAANADYRDGWWRFDTRTIRARALGIGPGIVTVDATIFPDHEKARDPFAQEFLARHGLGDHAAFLSADAVGGGLMAVSSHRSPRDGPYGPDEIAVMQRLAPHVANSFRFASRLAEARREAADIASALERLGFGVVLLGRSGRVVHVNALAEMLLSRVARLERGRRVQALLAADRGKLDRLVDAVLLDPLSAGSASLVLRSIGDDSPVLVEAMPLRPGEALSDTTAAQGAGALLKVTELFPSTVASIVTILEELGLSRAEARVAELVGRGRSPGEAARSLGLADATIRVHLRSSFSKLNIRRQSELAVLVTRLDAVRRRS